MTYSLDTLSSRNSQSPGVAGGVKRFAHEVGLILGLLGLVFWLVALISYSQHDAAWSTSGAAQATGLLPAGLSCLAGVELGAVPLVTAVSLETGLPFVIVRKGAKDYGTAKLIDKIARDGADTIQLETHRTLPPVLKELKHEGYQLVGLEQTTNSQNLHAFAFERKTVIVVGNERAGLADDVLAVLDHVVEIPVYGLPYSYNVATATAMALYEYCRQFPRG